MKHTAKSKRKHVRPTSCVELTPDLRTHLTEESKRRGVSMSVVIRWALLKYFEADKIAV